MTNTALAKAYSGWLDTVEELRRQRLVVARAVSRLQHRALSYAFQGWADATEAAKARMAVLTRCVGKFAHQ
eukprot:scaffold662365_cov57-Prasinocladus_malaysianus.AAC.1